MRFLLDDNVPFSIKHWLQEKGYEVFKAMEVGLKGAEDDKIYDYALDNNYRIITLDLDFGYLFLKFQKGTIIMLRPKKMRPKEILSLLEHSFEVVRDKEGLIVIKPGKVRVQRF